MSDAVAPEPITITGVRRHGVSDWLKGAATALAIAAIAASLIGVGVFIGVCYVGGIWTHTILCASSCRSYWRHEL